MKGIFFLNTYIVYMTFPASLPIMFCLETLSINYLSEIYLSKLLLDVCNWQDNSNRYKRLRKRRLV